MEKHLHKTRLTIIISEIVCKIKFQVIFARSLPLVTTRTVAPTYLRCSIGRIYTALCFLSGSTYLVHSPASALHRKWQPQATTCLMQHTNELFFP